MADEDVKMDVAEGEEDIDTTMNELSQMIEGDDVKKEETDEKVEEKKPEEKKEMPEEGRRKKKKVVEKTVRPPVISGIWCFTFYPNKFFVLHEQF